MKRVFGLLIIIIFANQVSGQTKIAPVSELQYVSFISEVHGILSPLLNPAGLSSRANDDGVLVNYDFLNPWEKGERNFTLTMSRLAFAYQEFALDDDVPNSTLRIYRLGISVGGKVLSLGTSNNILELQWPDRTKRAFSVDVGLMLQPIDGIGLSVFARDLAEPTIGDYQFKREYTTGIGIRLLDQRFKILAEAIWNDQTHYVEQARLKAGLSIVPVRNLGILVGGIVAEGVQEIYLRNQHFFAAIQIPFFGGIRFMAATRINEKQQFLRYSASMFIPLKTITF